MSSYDDFDNSGNFFDFRNMLVVFLPLNILFLASIFITDPTFHNVQYFYQWIVILVMIVVFPVLNYFVFFGFSMILYILVLFWFKVLNAIWEIIRNVRYKEEIDTKEDINRTNLIHMYLFWGGYFVYILGQCVYLFQGGTLGDFYKLISSDS